MEKIMDDIFEKIDQMIKEKKIQKQLIAEKLGYKNSSGFSQAMKTRSLKVTHFMEIAKLLGVHPAELLPGAGNPAIMDLGQMSLVDLIKTISKSEIDKYLKPEA